MRAHTVNSRAGEGTVHGTLLPLLRWLFDLLLPRHCAGCGLPDATWCAGCAAALRTPFAVLREATAHGPPAYALGPYLGAARRAVLAVKEGGRRDLLAPLGQALATALVDVGPGPGPPGAARPRLPGVGPAPDGTWYLVPAPSRPAAVRRRGGSHLLALARQCAATLAAAGHPAAVAPVLRLDGRARDSVGLSAAARSANLRGRLHPVPAAAPPPGQPVIVLDDVLTTGATAAACTATLTAASVPVAAILTLTATV